MRPVKIIIPAAGKGTRFKELGRSYPKCLLPYNGKPILKHNLDAIFEQLGANVHMVSVVVLKTDWEKHQTLFLHCVPNGYEHLVEFFAIDSTSGPAESFYAGFDAGRVLQPVLLMLSDSIFSKLKLRMYADNVSKIAVFDSVPDMSRWCMVRELSDGVLDIHDKPTHQLDKSYRAMAGLYYFRDGSGIKTCLESYLRCKQENETQFAPVILDYNKRCEPVYCVAHNLADILDMGTLEDYLQARNMVKPRSFNSVELHERSVVKSSSVYPNKIMQEAAWLTVMQREAPNFVPRVLDIDIHLGAYTTERMHQHNLRNLAVYYDTSEATWLGICKSINEWLTKAQLPKKVVTGDVSEFWKGFNNRIATRLPVDMQQEVWLLILDNCLPFFEETTLYHGDMHFGNMFYDYASNQVRLIDPRGEIYGHWLYDVAKLLHSLYGCYDHIEEDLYFSGEDSNICPYDEMLETPRKVFENTIWVKLSPQERKAAKAICAALFITMIPLHADNEEHQQAFTATYNKLKDINTWLK